MSNFCPFLDSKVTYKKYGRLHTFFCSIFALVVYFGQKWLWYGLIHSCGTFVHCWFQLLSRWCQPRSILGLLVFIWVIEWVISETVFKRCDHSTAWYLVIVRVFSACMVFWGIASWCCKFAVLFFQIRWGIPPCDIDWSLFSPKALSSTIDFVLIRCVFIWLVSDLYVWSSESGRYPIHPITFRLLQGLIHNLGCLVVKEIFLNCTRIIIKNRLCVHVNRVGVSTLWLLSSIRRRRGLLESVKHSWGLFTTSHINSFLSLLSTICSINSRPRYVCESFLSNPMLSKY